MGADELDQTALLRWIDVELAMDRELLEDLRRMVARSAQLELIAELARTANDHDQYLPPALDRARMALRLALIELDTNPMLR